jgi:eukaryotic-like serine/threonine-protein kinase
MLGKVLLDKYQVVRLLDQGGMCKIWLARQLDVSREVVVKALQERFASQPKSRDFLRREIHILSRFQHPNAVAYYDAAPNDPSGPILIMEYLRGLDLATLLQREGRLMPERAGRLLAQLCGVLGAAHKAGIVHRDIKPANVMIIHPCTPQETVKLMDFGLAKMASLLYIGADDLLDSTLLAVAGTPEYIAPDQALGREIDARSDLYSLGVLLYEMLCGRRPFTQVRPEDLLHAHAHDEPPFFADHGITYVPPAVETVVRACLAKAPEQRPSDAAELLQRYEGALGKRLSASSRGSSGLFPIRQALSAPPPSGSIPRLPSTPTPSVSRHTLRQAFECDMPEAMAMLKLKGFLHDLGSDVIASEPGMIRVRLGEPEAAKKKSGVFALLDRATGKSGMVKRSSGTEVELRMARPDPTRPNCLLIMLIMRPSNGFITEQWRTRCQQIAQDLKAYLMGR